MVEHVGLFGGQAGERCCGGKLVGNEEQVVGEAEVVQGSQAAAKFRPEHELSVGLILHHMPHADKPRMVGEGPQLLGNIGGSQIDPAHHPPDQRMPVG